MVEQIHCYRCRINEHSSRCCLCFESSDPAPLISRLTQRYPAAANKHDICFIRQIALTFAMSVNIDIRGRGGEADTHDESDECLFVRHRYGLSTVCLYSYIFYYGPLAAGHSSVFPMDPRCSWIHKAHYY